MKEYKWLVCNALCEIGVFLVIFSRKKQRKVNAKCVIGLNS